MSSPMNRVLPSLRRAEMVANVMREERANINARAKLISLLGKQEIGPAEFAEQERVRKARRVLGL